MWQKTNSHTLVKYLFVYLFVWRILGISHIALQRWGSPKRTQNQLYCRLSRNQYRISFAGNFLYLDQILEISGGWFRKVWDGPKVKTPCLADALGCYIGCFGRTSLSQSDIPCYYLYGYMVALIVWHQSGINTVMELSR